ncbi:MAG: PAS domain S-box protein, partial [Thermodesulfobacteriota bacterium]|nr:PAS domain S-box protein [Thermodesulfobacteriota bacterium]
MDDESRRKRVLETLREMSQKTTNSERLKVQRNEPEELLSIVYHALESSINAIIITDLKEKIKYVNPSFIRMFGYQNKDQALNDDAAGLFDQNRIKRLTDVIWIIDKQQGNTQEFNARRIDGGEFPVLVSVSNINDMKGNLIGRMASFVDLTERKQAQKLLGESKRHIQILSSKLLEAEEEA